MRLRVGIGCVLAAALSLVAVPGRAVPARAVPPPMPAAAVADFDGEPGRSPAAPPEAATTSSSA